MITQSEALDLTNYLRNVLDGKVRGGARCWKAAIAAKTTGREDDDDLIQDTLARIIEHLDDRLPRAELRAYARETLHNIAVDKARKGVQTRRHIARYAETVYGLSAPSCEREVELADLLEAELTSSEKLMIGRLMAGEQVQDRRAKKQLRDKLSKLGASPTSLRMRDVSLEELARGLHMIPEQYREAAELLIAGNTPTAIASQLKITKATARKYIFRARLAVSGESLKR